MGKKLVKVPQVMQMEAEECGAACLDMVCCYYKKWLPLEQVRMDCGVSRDGSNALNIIKAAKEYGLEVKATTCNLQYLANEVSFPVILHWNFNHFVVLAGYKGTRAIINDPARGKVSVSANELNRSFTGVCMELAPGPAFQCEGKKPSVLRFIKSRLSGMKSALVFIMISTLLSSVGALLLPVFYKFYLDKVLAGFHVNLLFPFMVAFFCLIVFQLMASLLNEAVIRKFRGKLSIVSNMKFMWHSLCLPLDFFSQRNSADIANRLGENEIVANIVTNKLAPLMVNLVMAAIYFVLMVRYSLKMALIAFGATVLNLVVTSFASHGKINYANATMINESKLSSTTVNGIGMIETLKASGAENGFFNRWAGTRSQLTETMVKFRFTDTLFQAIPPLVRHLSRLLVLMLGVNLIIQGRFTVGALVAFQVFMDQFMMPVENLINSQQSLEEMTTSIHRIWDVMDYPADVSLEGKVSEGKELELLKGDIDISNLMFGYSRMLPPVISSFDLHIERGKRIALVGPTGSGKSTLVKLILGLCQSWEGEVLFDGKKRSEYQHEVMTASVAVVDQEIKVFEGTLMDNMKLWDNTIDDSVVIQACRDAQIHQEIMLRSGGYSCMVDEGGKNFSGGQLQRFEIARVLALNPSVLILDEATSAVDADTEY
ncbi:MAG: cysteine peptidase family C39 domain-containing protein, partial [Sphaerochaetaceae bacterium]